MKLSLCARLGAAALVPLFLALSSVDARADDPPPVVDAGEPPPSSPSLTAPSPAAEEEAPPVPVERRFGRAGEVVLSSAFGLSGYSSRYSSSEAHFTGITLSPAIDVFVVDHLSVGADVTYSRSDSLGYAPSGALYSTQATQLSAGARIAVDVPLGAHVSWWPRLTLGYQTSHDEEPAPTDAATTAVTRTRGPFVVVYAPLLIHPVPHFFLGFGPILSRDLGRTASVAVRPVHDQTVLGAHLVVGGWL